MSLKIKGEFQTLFCFIIDSIENINDDIAKQVSGNPDLFKLAPVIVEPASNLDLSLIVDACTDNGLIVVGVKTTDESHIRQAASLRLRVSKPKSPGSTPTNTQKVNQQPELGYKIILFFNIKSSLSFFIEREGVGGVF